MNAIAPFFELGDLGPGAALIAAVVIGIAFGWTLERAGLGSAPKLAAQFYFADLTVFKVMFSAIVTAMLGAFWLGRLGLLDLGRVYVPETYLLPQLAGGLLFGIGFVIAGLCPGTSCVAAATGRGDGLLVILGMFTGVFGTGLAFGSISNFYASTARGALTLPQLLHVPYGAVVFGVVAMALIAFWMTRRLGSSLDGRTTAEDSAHASDRAPSLDARGIFDRAPSDNSTQPLDRAPSPPCFSTGEKVPKADEGAFERTIEQDRLEERLGIATSSSSIATPPSSGFATFSPRKKRGGRRRSIREFGVNLTAQFAWAALLLGALAAFAGSPYRATRATVDVQRLALAVAHEEDHVTAIELAEWIRGRKVGLRIIDLRTASEFETYHVPRAERIAIESLATAPLRATDTIVLISGGGAHAAQAWVLLQALGYKQVYFLRGGLQEWIDDVMNPTILATATPAAMADFKRVGEISRYFGGVPRIVDKLEPRAANTEGDGSASSTSDAAAAIRRRGC
jgi:rhodanese-related sulfurtransferase